MNLEDTVKATTAVSALVASIWLWVRRSISRFTNVLDAVDHPETGLVKNVRDLITWRAQVEQERLVAKIKADARAEVEAEIEAAAARADQSGAHRPT